MREAKGGSVLTKLSLTFVVNFGMLKKNICFLEFLIVWYSIFSWIGLSSWEDLGLRRASSVRCTLKFIWIRIQQFANTRSGHMRRHLSASCVFTSTPFLVVLPVIYNLLFLQIVISATYVSSKPWHVLSMTGCPLMGTNMLVKILPYLPSATLLHHFSMFRRLYQLKRLTAFIKFQKFR